MTRAQFNIIFENEIVPLINEICDNNSLIKIKDLEKCKRDIFDSYSSFNYRYKKEIFGKETNCLLDRHKIASCICGAFLKVSIFDKTDLINYIKSERLRIESYFFYVNELISFMAACRFLSFFITYDNRYNPGFTLEMLRQFPLAPAAKQNKRGFWTSIIFNLSQIKNEEQIGIKSYDMYAYAMIFFLLERHFLDQLHINSNSHT